jgi:hypothetical protein
VATPRNRLQLVGGQHRVGARLRHMTGELLLQARHADHEELVDADAQDGEEPQALQERQLRIARLLEHPLEERQRGKLAVDEISWIAQGGLRRVARAQRRGGVHGRAAKDQHKYVSASVTSL